MREKQILALGFFDGVHLGHRALLGECRRLADALGCGAAAVTFGTHPDALVLGRAPALINTLPDRQRLLLDGGMDDVIVLLFDKTMQTMPWEDFFDLLLEKYRAAGLVCGHDFRFGNRGEGTAELLRTRCARRGIPCTVIPEKKLDGITVSSTHIRTLLEQGEMETAVQFLGHPHILTGTVMAGHRLGRTLGIPTANLALPEGVVVPKYGVYACRCHVGQRCFLAVTNIGTRPTVGGTYVTVEAWLQDFDEDLYGRQITLEFYKFLRPERRFPSLGAMQEEIRENARQTRELMG